MGVILKEGDEPDALERWNPSDSAVRFDQEICGAALAFMAAHQVKTVVLSAGIIGCPHEEGVDDPEGQKWVQRPTWAGETPGANDA